MSPDANSGPGSPLQVVDATEACPGAKRLATARARASLVDVELLRTDPADGDVRFYIQRGDQVHQIRTLDDLEAVLVGGVSPHC